MKAIGSLGVGVAFGLACGAVLPSLRLFADSTDLEDEVQIRVFADRGTALPDGRKGGAVQVYGMRVQKDGSEEVVWRHFLWEFQGLLFRHDYHYLPLNAEQAFLHFPEDERPSLDGFFELDRQKGIILRRASSSDQEFLRMRQEHHWYAMVILDRPVTDDPQPQKTKSSQ
jgi:hypothetical protein